ncbi:MAG TPA: TIGR00282 family metallophosphoesterase [Bacillota bacterium]|nr:TIGR00282 family metallophosphoesterase [Bacillota bacterium]HPF42117.1 TIGR00282 family metallophosphoesterase [Bacillota bacterium]HPJ85356.1 TIGR00282 family metallophosphoesterase [Bacillota bacterium]HPQ61348.1 TIGR00282 family metallophosphoesterase [Bacillota bacterium]HRX91418.1 TIGR00282 family metallophosphoesterase [Candidatus Izemoplasmatales bacterium]
MRVLFIGDVYMEKGREAFDRFFSTAKQLYRPNFIVVNGENIANGNGLSEEIYKDYMKRGVNVFTLGNHAYSRKDSGEVLNLDYVVRPANYGPGAAGKGFVTCRVNDKTITVVNLLGRVFMNDPIDSPFIVADEVIQKCDSDYIIIDFHAEATSEKYALANYLDGRVSALVGTHTHVTTADECVFPKGMLYITDIGMTGVKYSIIGGDIGQGLRKFITGIPERTRPEKNGPLQFSAVLLDLEQKRIERVNYAE